MTTLFANSVMELAVKKSPFSISTLGGAGFHFSRFTASASKMAQMGPPPLTGSPVPASAALRKFTERGSY